jgi:2-methylcitrate dehydratase
VSVGATDRWTEALAQAAHADVSGDGGERLKTILIDSFAVALAALKHPAALAARRYASAFLSEGAPCAIWGTSRRANAEVAALANGVLLRCHDYNDLYIGRKSWGHPSDIVAALLALAERVRTGGNDFLDALAVGYDITLALFDTLPAASVGWDYSNLTAIGAVCASARLMKLTPQQTREALAIAVIPHFASDEIESGDLNRRGDLTMWKRFNAGDAIRQAVYACDLARAGVEGAVWPFEGKYGFLNKLGASVDALAVLRETLSDHTRLGRVVLKRWPVGSRAQSAIQAALDARSKVGNVENIAAIRVSTTDAVFKHLVRSRPAPWAPISRETADHSLPYIVASAVLDGRIGTDSFSPQRVRDPAQQAFVKKVEVTPDLPGPDLAAFGAKIEIVMSDGRSIAADQSKPVVPDENGLRQMVEAKFSDSGKGRISPTKVAAALEMLRALEDCSDLRSLTRLLAVADDAQLDRDSEE